MTKKLTPRNYKKGFLIDAELMAAVSVENSGIKKGYLAYVVRHTTGETLGSESHQSLTEALSRINQIKRNWTYESTTGCDGDCSDSTPCQSGDCDPVECFKGSVCDNPKP